MITPDIFKRFKTRILNNNYSVSKYNYNDFIKNKDENINENLKKFKTELSTSIQKIPEKEKIIKPEILIPCFNHGKFLPSALESIICDFPIDITVINDASTDDTGQIIDNLKKDFPFKLITNMSNLDKWASLNKAISISENNFFILLDSDDILTRYWLNLVIENIQSLEGVRLIGGNSIHFNIPGALNLNNELPEKLQYKPISRIFEPQDTLKFTNLNSINMTCSGCCFLKSAWNFVGGFRHYEQRICSYDDRDFQMRVCCFFSVAIFDEPSAFYRVNSSTWKFF